MKDYPFDMSIIIGLLLAFFIVFIVSIIAILWGIIRSEDEDN